MIIAGSFASFSRLSGGIPKPLPRLMADPASGMEIRVWKVKSTRGLPELLVSASRKQGSAVRRNLFRRRVRHAFLDLLRFRPEPLEGNWVVWVRPVKSLRDVGILPSHLIKGQLMLALGRLTSS